MRLFLLFLIACFSNAVYGQYCPEETFPYPPSPDMDWREDVFYEKAYIQTSATVVEEDEIPSPFYEANPYQQNVEYLVGNVGDVKDFEPDDGWVLVKKFFGNPDFGVRFPTFVLYNRYESKLRIFSWVTDANGYDNAVVKLRFKSIQENADYVSAALSLSNTPSPVIEGYVSMKEYIQVPNVFYSQFGLWLTGDYSIAYDPCTCREKSELVVELELFDTQDITLKLQGGGVLDQIIGSGGTVGNSTKGFAPDGGVGADVKKGYAYYKKVDKLVTDSKKRLVALANKKVAGGGANSNQINNLMISFGYGNSFDNTDITNLMQQVQTGSAGHKTLAKAVLPPNNSKMIPDFLNSVMPIAGTILQFLDFFVGGGKTSPPTPMHFSTQLEFSGSGEIIDPAPGPRYIFYTPGSNQSEWNGPVREPFYKNVMGVINLTEKPVLQRAFEIDQYSSVDESRYTRFDSYKQAEPIKFSINPAAGLELKEIRGAYYFDRCFIGDESSPSANRLGSELNEAGLIPVEDRKWRTPFIPLGCLEDYVVKMSHTEEVTPHSSGATGFRCEGEVTFALKTIFKRTDNPDADEVAVDILFPVEIVDAPYSWENTPANPYEGIQEELVVENIDDLLNPNTVSWDKIEYKGDLNIRGISAQQLSELLGIEPTVVTNSGSGVASYHTLEYADFFSLPGGAIPINSFFNRVPSCPTVAPVDEVYLNSFCDNHNKYNPIASLGYWDDNPEEPVEVPVLEDAELFPNPTSDFTKLKFLNNIQKANYSVAIYNALGQKVKTIYSDLIIEQVQYVEFYIPLADLPNGVYSLEVLEAQWGAQKTFRVVKN